MAPLLAVAWSWSITALAGAVTVVGAAVVRQVALLARSEGDLALQAVVAPLRTTAAAQLRARLVGIGGAALLLGVVALFAMDQGAARGRVVAALIGVVIVLASQAWALRVVTAAPPRLVEAAALPAQGLL